MSIQQSVNQLIGTAGAFAAIDAVANPEKKELKALGKQEKLLGQQQQEFNKSRSDALQQQSTLDPKSKEYKALEQKIEAQDQLLANQAKNSLDVAQKQFGIKPTKESLDKLTKAQKRYGDLSGESNVDIFRDAQEAKMKTLEQRMDEAMKKVEQLKKAKQKQSSVRRSFDPAFKALPTSLGGTVGDLPENIQKQIKAQYNDPKKRKAVMDQYYNKQGGNQ